ncbi:oligopeptide ABC transporter permease [Gammaproteobacteria bacterium]|nr:oligopeptide ABC transporter permease [Gammaproteobacteria bacterium]
MNEAPRNKNIHNNINSNNLINNQLNNKTKQHNAQQMEVLANSSTLQGRSLWIDARRRLLKNKAAVVAMIILIIFTLMAILAPWIASHPLDEIYWDSIQVAPNIGEKFWFGTDANGRDLFVRTLYGMRVSLLVGLLATVVAVGIGITYGAVAGYMGGKTDMLMMRFVDIMYALPFMFFVILLMVVFGRNIFLIFIALGCVEWLTMARIVRGQTLSIRNKEFIEAAIACGLPTWKIIFKHVIPNILGPVIVYITLTIPQVIMMESFISFLGLGVQEPLTSLGVLISDGAKVMESYWWMLIFPALFLSIMLFSLNFLGDGLRDALDPKER